METPPDPQPPVFSAIETVVKIVVLALLLGWCFLILKPILLGHGAPVPIPVIFLGAIGGFMATGFLGLFVGAIVLSIGYKLFMSWLATGDEAALDGTDGTDHIKAEG